MVRLATNGMTEKDIEGGNNRPAPGMYHAMIETVRELPDQNYVQYDFVILAGTVADQGGKIISQRLYIEGKDEKGTAMCTRRITRFAVETGAMDRSDIGKDVDVDLALAEGRDCIIKVIEREYDEKDKETGAKTGKKKKSIELDFFGVWSTDDEEVAQVPRDPAWARRLSSSSSPPKSSGSSSGNGKAQPVAAGAAAGGNDFDDI